VALLLAGCSTEADDRQAARESSDTPSETGIPTLTMSPLPSYPPTGEITADMRQSSRDVALGRMEVWVLNDTAHQVRPRRIVYRDGRFRTPLLGERLRPIPSQSERGYPLTLPLDPVCDSDATHGELVIRLEDRTVRMQVEDETDVPGRYLATRCTELAVARVADVRWLDDVPSRGSGEGSVGVLRLRVAPTGEGALRIRYVTGTPMIRPETGDVWRPRLSVGPGDDPVVLELPFLPARCDDHVFMESAGATAFKIGLVVDGEPATLLLRMSPEGSSAAIDQVRASCGL